MKVALIAPLRESIPPSGYGGIELYLYFLANGLVEKGIDVTLFATAQTKTKAKLIPVVSKPIIHDKSVKRREAFIPLLLSEVIPRIDQFDILHNHIEFEALPLVPFINKPMITHLHGPLIPEVFNVYKKFNNDNSFYASVSKIQQKMGPKLNYIANIYHGIPFEKYEFNNKPKDYLVWLGRISKQKNTLGAIRVAQKTGQKLILAGIVSRSDIEYFEMQIKPLIDNKQIFYVGEQNFEQKNKLLKNAKVMLFPIDWPEPFGLVLIEAAACGTPVIAMRAGSVPEIIKNGKNGFVVDNIEQMSKAVSKIGKINRKECRRYTEEKFNIQKMIDEHIAMYKKVLKKSSSKT